MNALKLLLSLALISPLAFGLGEEADGFTNFEAIEKSVIEKWHPKNLNGKSVRLTAPSDISLFIEYALKGKLGDKYCNMRQIFKEPYHAAHLAAGMHIGEILLLEQEDRYRIELEYVTGDKQNGARVGTACGKKPKN